MNILNLLFLKIYQNKQKRHYLVTYDIVTSYNSLLYTEHEKNQLIHHQMEMDPQT
uniref:J3L n=1 Tax=Tanapox virus TaxID=99000 RepID=Q9IGV0_9POXV|nr:J3L [Tanapox virus]